MSTRLLKLVLALWMLGTVATLGASEPATAQELDWIRQHGQIEGVQILSSAFGEDGSSYVGGAVPMYGETSFNSQGFVRAYDPDGTIRWTRQFASPGPDTVCDIAVDANRRVIVAGIISVGESPYPSGITNTNTFVRAYDASGFELWTARFDSGQESCTSGVAVDAQNNIYVAGDTDIALPGQILVGQRDAFVRVYSPDGVEIRTLQFGTGGWVDATAIAVSSDGVLYIVGRTDGSFSGNAPEDDWTRAFVRAYDSTGMELWTDQFGPDMGWAGATGVAVDQVGRVFVAGNTSGNIPGARQPITYGAFLRLYDASGTVVWTVQLDAQIEGLRIDRNGHALVEGITSSYLSGSTLSPGEHVFVRAYDLQGEPVWTEQFDIHTPNPPRLRSTGMPEGILLRWDLPWPRIQHERDLVEVRVYSGSSESAAFDHVASLPIQTRTWMDVRVPPGVEHYYYVTSADVRGNESEPSNIVRALWREADTPESFMRTWSRTDLPVERGNISRTWMWGPEPFTGVLFEDYASAPDGRRQVKYFDKSRMEDNTFRTGSSWEVTNGLLATELITGWLQVGDEEFVQLDSANINIAGDAGSGPTYAMLDGLRWAEPIQTGAPITTRLHSNGRVSVNDGLATLGATGAVYVQETMHTVASPFWDFMNASGLVYEDGDFIEGRIFLNPFYATGYPITEAYWARVNVAGTPQDVLVQCFERRCLTYTSGNPVGWQVEAGNVGLHYYQWRYGTDQLAPPGQIAFVARTGEGFNTFDIFVMSASDSEPTNITNDPAFDTRPVWSPDARHILFTSDRDGGGIFVMDADGGNLRKITTADVQLATPTWSPDGRKIAFARDGDILTISLDGTNLQNLTNSAALDSEPAWSPTGDRIAYTSQLAPEPDANQHRKVIHVVNADGTGDTPLTPDLYTARAPVWSPNGLRIAFEHSEDREYGYTQWIRLVDPDIKAIRRSAMCSGYHGCYGFAWSPDSIWLAVARDLTRQDDSGAQLVIASTYDDIPSEKVVATGTTIADPSWSSDGNYLAFALNGDLAIADMEGNQVTLYSSEFRVDSGITWSPGR
jgi:Tol biopolymer transport system component